MVFVHSILDTPSRAVEAVDGLVEASFRQADVSVLAANPREMQEFRSARRTALPPAVAGASIALVALSLPGSGFGLLAAGPIRAALQAARGSAVGGLVGALGALGYWKRDADIPAEALEKGGVLVGVHVPPAQIGQAAEVLRACGAELVQAT